MATDAPRDTKGHVCPPSSAQHPSDRWETLFVYSFICKFTNVRSKVEGLESPMDLEEALISPEASPILTEVLGRFVRNLRPQTRNLSSDQISSTVASIMAEYLKSSERTIFWDEDLNMNVDPFQDQEGGFFGGDWDFKLKILRQLVELQLSHSTEVKAVIDGAWGVVHNKHKKKETKQATVTTDESKTQEALQFVPIGQDSNRKRFWVADDSPRVYVSTNPWKMTASFQAVSSTKEEYLQILEDLKASAPSEPKKGERRTKVELLHMSLITALEERIPAIDTELARVQRVRKRIENKKSQFMLAEMRTTRTRRQTRRPDYVYTDTIESDDDADEYIDRGDENDREEFDDDDFLNFRNDEANGSGSRRSSTATRRSTRTAVVNANGNREVAADGWGYIPGERRSSRRHNADNLSDPEPPQKRARTVESIASDAPSVTSAASAVDADGLKQPGAAAVKSTEVAVEQVAGKKKSKFWYYAVEPIPGATPHTDDTGGGAPQGEANGHNGHAANGNGPHGNSSPPEPQDAEMESPRQSPTPTLATVEVS
ncbi:hypothetical protein HGRIS_008218 [Hohenbuehelia grisea]|uniref:WHIM1 domain-containing protein n=1 Tax=Hohenbuehelia grisea TaxID=104357 RepID=A0ABR3J7C6_9AGAR